MDYQSSILQSVAEFVSNNLNYTTTYMQSLCLLQAPLAKELNEFKHSGMIFGKSIDHFSAQETDSTRDACLAVVRQMLYRLSTPEAELQWYYDKDRHKGAYEALMSIDQCGKILHENKQESLSAYIIPILDQYEAFLTWIIHRYGNANIEPISFHYTEMDRRDLIEKTLSDDYPMSTHERLVDFFVTRHAVLDLLGGNQPIDHAWRWFIHGSEGAEALYRIATSHSIEMISDSLNKVSRHISSGTH